MKIRKEPGWLFGDVALLFNSQRSASVVAATDISLWALNGRFFSQVQMYTSDVSMVESAQSSARRFIMRFTGRSYQIEDALLQARQLINANFAALKGQASTSSLCSLFSIMLLEQGLYGL